MTFASRGAPARGRPVPPDLPTPVGGSLTLSALVATIPLLTVFFTLGVLRWKAHWAGLCSVLVALVIAVAVWGMPAGRAVLAATQAPPSASSPSCGSSSPRSCSTR